MKKKLIITIILFYTFLSFNLINAENLTVEQINTSESLELTDIESIGAATASIEDYNLLGFFAERQDDLAQLNRDYLGFTIIIFIGVIGVLGFLFYFTNLRPYRRELKTAEKRIKKIEKDERILSEEINLQKQNLKKIFSLMDKQKIDTFSFIKEQKLETTNWLKTQENRFEAEKARSLALHSETLKANDRVFFWWIKAAYYFYKIDTKEPLTLVAINKAKTGLENIKEIHMEVFKEDLPLSEIRMGELAEKYPKEIKEIRELVVRKLADFKT